MKNFFLLLFFTLIGLSTIELTAQDTVTFEDSCYIIKNKKTKLAWSTSEQEHIRLFLPLVHAVADFTVDKPTPVYGIAITMDTTPDRNSPNFPYYFLDYYYFSDTNRILQLKLMKKSTYKDSVANPYTIIDSMSFDAHGVPALQKACRFQYLTDSSLKTCGVEGVTQI